MGGLEKFSKTYKGGRLFGTREYEESDCIPMEFRIHVNRKYLPLQFIYCCLPALGRELIFFENPAYITTLWYGKNVGNSNSAYQHDAK